MVLVSYLFHLFLAELIDMPHVSRLLLWYHMAHLLHHIVCSIHTFHVELLAAKKAKQTTTPALQLQETQLLETSTVGNRKACYMVARSNHMSKNTKALSGHRPLG